MLSNNPSLADIRAAIKESGQIPARFLEKERSLADALALRRLITINECHEPLAEVSDPRISRMLPHAYMMAGAPYGSGNPFCLREGVIERLSNAQTILETYLPGACLSIFDGYRPRAVQEYMRHYEFRAIARNRGLDPETASPTVRAELWGYVNNLWAIPGTNPHLPPPHATGAAIDLTIIDRHGVTLSMGTDFDESSPRILPSHFDHRVTYRADEIATNRELLREVMESAGFKRLSHEWWHFSYGDQFWALLKSLESGASVVAMYGEVE